MELQALLAEIGVDAAEKQRVDWDFQSWRHALEQAPLASVAVPALEDLEDRWATDGGIARAAVTEVAGGDPVRLLVTSMAWGFGSIPYGPSRTAKMLGTRNVEGVLAEIVEAAQGGAETAFSALFCNGKARVSELSIAMGSKVLYFAAGGRAAQRGDPLVYDANVHWALTTLEGAWPDAPDPGKRMSSERYASYVNRIDGYALESGLARDDVEVALFGASRWLRRRRRVAEREQRRPGTLSIPTGPPEPI